MSLAVSKYGDARTLDRVAVCSDLNAVLGSSEAFGLCDVDIVFSGYALDLDVELSLVLSEDRLALQEIRSELHAETLEQ